MKINIFLSVLIVFLISLNSTFAQTDTTAQKNTTHHYEINGLYYYVEFFPIDDSCVLLENPPISLSYFVTPVGGTFTGKGVVAGEWFDPKEAGVGEHLITYDYYGNKKRITVKVKNPKVIY